LTWFLIIYVFYQSAVPDTKLEIIERAPKTTKSITTTTSVIIHAMTAITVPTKLPIKPPTKACTVNFGHDICGLVANDFGEAVVLVGPGQMLAQLLSFVHWA
jgi:hypothetical protein